MRHLAASTAVAALCPQRLVCQAIPLLQAVHAQHPGNSDRLTAHTPTCPRVGYSGSITAIRRAQGTTRSISARNFSRRVRFFFNAYSALAKLRWFMSGALWNLVFLCMHEAYRDRLINQRLLSVTSGNIGRVMA